MESRHTEEALLQKAAAYCSRAEHCIREVDEKLQAWGAQEAQRQAVIGRLTEDGYIDQRRYARAYAHDKFLYNKWGKMKIVMALRAKGIAPEDIDPALEQIDEQAYAQTLLRLLEGKAKRLSYKNEYERRGKLFRFALSRGFEPQVIEQAIGEMDR